MSPPHEGEEEEGALNVRVQDERGQIFKAMSIVECCRYASASLYPCDDQEFMVPALEAAHDLLNDVVEALETIATEVKSTAALQSRRSRARAKKGEAPVVAPGASPSRPQGES